MCLDIDKEDRKLLTLNVCDTEKLTQRWKIQGFDAELFEKVKNNAYNPDIKN